MGHGWRRSCSEERGQQRRCGAGGQSVNQTGLQARADKRAMRVQGRVKLRTERGNAEMRQLAVEVRGLRALHPGRRRKKTMQALFGTNNVGNQTSACGDRRATYSCNGGARSSESHPVFGERETAISCVGNGLSDEAGKRCLTKDLCWSGQNIRASRYPLRLFVEAANRRMKRGKARNELGNCRRDPLCPLLTQALSDRSVAFEPQDAYWILIQGKYSCHDIIHDRVIAFHGRSST